MKTRAFDIRVDKLPRKSEHHICPRSRGGKSDKKNKVRINRGLHERYHSLFENCTPEEIIEFLSTYFWGNKYEVIITKK